MKNTDTIAYNDKRFSLRYVEVEGETLPVSTDDLNDILFDENDNYKSEVARTVDEKIYCFVTDEEFEKSDEELAKIIKEKYW